jgi:hypothetical protein
MGKIKQGILGGFSGKVGGVIGSSWKGIAVVKAMPLSVAQPVTTKKTNAKARFSVVVAASKEILNDTIKPLLDRNAVKMSGYNLFAQMNKAYFTHEGTITPSNIKISSGRVAFAGSDLAGSVQ